MPNKVIAIIPARSGSKSVKNKNIKIFNGKPLIAWSIKTCLQSKYINKIFVSTDSSKYARVAEKFGVNDIILRPKSISRDSSSDYEMIKHAIENINCEFDIIAHIRPTTPLRDLKIFNSAIKFFLYSKYNSLRSVHEMSETAYKSFEIEKGNLKPICKIKSKNLKKHTLPMD